MKCHFVYLALFFTCGQNLEIERKFFQNKYTFTLERVVLISTNKDLTRNVTLTTFKYNRTTTFANVTIEVLRDVKEFWVHVVAYKFDVSDYKRTAIEFRTNVCTILRRNVFGSLQVKTAGNFTNCPLKKGFYVATNCHIISEEFPPNLPEGRWKVQANGTADGVFSGTFELYGRIDYPIRN